MMSPGWETRNRKGERATAKRQKPKSKKQTGGAQNGKKGWTKGKLERGGKRQRPQGGGTGELGQCLWGGRAHLEKVTLPRGPMGGVRNQVKKKIGGPRWS